VNNQIQRTKIILIRSLLLREGIQYSPNTLKPIQPHKSKEYQNPQQGNYILHNLLSDPTDLYTWKESFNIVLLPYNNSEPGIRTLNNLILMMVIND
jgi:uncharacterized protein YheU (UPF0270 family)